MWVFPERKGDIVGKDLKGNEIGKGIVQTVFPLENGDAIKITTAKYDTPKEHYFHGKGIQPDIKLEYKYSGPEDESYDMKYDNQLQKAISVVKEKIN